MDIDKYRSVAVKREVVKIIEKLAELDLRTIPREIEFLVKKELKKRNINY